MPLIALLLAFAATDASASFTAPVELSAAPYGLGGTAATDAAGTTTVVITGANGALLRERRRGAAWSAGTRLPGRPKGVAGQVVEAAGNGALAIAWRIDSPRAYSGIAVALRDPGGALSQPIAIAGSAAGGVRHPALAIDARGDALLAYSAGTRKAHLSDRGKVAVTYRRAGGAFAKPVIVDGTTASAPKVALAPDGSGVVAWTRSGHVYGVVIGAGGRIGDAKALASAPGVSSLAVVAANGGVATVLWTARSSSQRRVSAVYNPRGGAFGRARTVASTSVFRVGAQAAADDRGRMVAAWREEGVAGSPGMVSSSIVAAGGVVGRPRGYRPRRRAPPHRLRHVAVGGDGRRSSGDRLGLRRRPPPVRRAGGDRVADRTGRAADRGERQPHERHLDAARGRRDDRRARASDAGVHASRRTRHPADAVAAPARRRRHLSHDPFTR
jgi:hypothetical protein